MTIRQSNMHRGRLRDQIDQCTCSKSDNYQIRLIFEEQGINVNHDALDCRVIPWRGWQPDSTRGFVPFTKRGALLETIDIFSRIAHVIVKYDTSIGSDPAGRVSCKPCVARRILTVAWPPGVIRLCWQLDTRDALFEIHFRTSLNWLWS